MDIDNIDLVVEGQNERTILDKSKRGYLSKMKVLTAILKNHPDVFPDTLATDANGVTQKHCGPASAIYKLNLPLQPLDAARLFALVSIDQTLARKRKRVAVVEVEDGDAGPRQVRGGEEEDAGQDGAQEDEEIAAGPMEVDPMLLVNAGGPIDPRNPAKQYVTVSAQTYQNYKSALKWWHELHNDAMEKVGVIWPAEVDKAVVKAIASYKRDVGWKKRQGIMKQREGKSGYNLNGYITLCKYFLKMRPVRNRFTWGEGLFGGLFHKMSVNTIGRSDNIDDILSTNCDWENDAMKTQFGTTKADQTGETTTEWKRIFCNPFNPAVCCLFQLALYLWCSPRSSKKDCQYLFAGNAQSKRYYKILMEALKQIPDDTDLGCSKDDIGTHSNRKFAESTSASKIDGPTRTQVCLRAGQSVGTTQKSYIFQEDDGDSIVGRTVAQLKLTADEFDILPPHFGTATSELIGVPGWKAILPGYQYWPESMQRVIRNLFPILVYGYKTGAMRDLLDSDHPIYRQPIFTNAVNRRLLDDLKDKIILVHGYCDDTNMSACGVPGIIVASREIRELKSQFDRTATGYEERIDRMNEYMEEKFESLPQNIVELLLKKFQIDGVVPVGVDEIRRLINEMMSGPDGAFADMNSKLTDIRDQNASIITRLEGGNAVTPIVDAVDNNQPRTTTGIVHYWPNDQRTHRVPHGLVSTLLHIILSNHVIILQKHYAVDGFFQVIILAQCGGCGSLGIPTRVFAHISI